MKVRDRAIEICKNLLRTLEKVNNRKVNPISIREEFKPATMSAKNILRKLSQVMLKNNITRKDLEMND